MQQKEHRQFAAMLAVARERLAHRDPQSLAQNAAVQYDAGCFFVKTLGRTVTVRLPEAEITPELCMWHTLPLLHYLDLADGTPLSGQPMLFAQHPDGLIRGSGFDHDAEILIRDKLGCLPPDELKSRCAALGAELLPSNADFCARFDFLPRYPLWLKVWFADDEFPASGRLLLDRCAPHYLTMEDAVTVGLLLLDLLTGAQHWSSE